MTKARRVAITGVGILSPIGLGYDSYYDSLFSLRSGVSIVPEWDGLGLRTRLGAKVLGFDGLDIPRKLRRSMSRVSLLAVSAAQEALKSSGLSAEAIQTEATGVAFGSTMGGTSAIEDYFKVSYNQELPLTHVQSTTFLKIMSHTCAAHVALALGIPGRVVASCTACASSTQALGFAFEAIRDGHVERMIAGGAEELHPAVVSVFDVMGATSVVHNSKPEAAPQPFSIHRDGIVVGEGAGAMLLEDMELAEKRGAMIYGEILGFATNNDAGHMTNPSVKGMRAVMAKALESAGLKAEQISYINAHGTGTLVGDHAESWAVHELFGSSMPISSLKGQYGHLMGACGVIELAGCLAMLKEQRLLPTKNLDQVDPNLASLEYIKHQPKPQRVDIILKNSFAFGGINATLIITKGSSCKP